MIHCYLVVVGSGDHLGDSRGSSDVLNGGVGVGGVGVGNGSQNLVFVDLEVDLGGISGRLGRQVFLVVCSFDDGFGVSRNDRSSQDSALLAAIGSSGSSGSGFFLDLEEFRLGSSYFLQFINTFLFTYSKNIDSNFQL